MIKTERRLLVVGADHDQHVTVTASHRCADDRAPTTTCADAQCDVVISSVIVREWTAEEPLAVSAVAVPITSISALVAALSTVATSLTGNDDDQDQSLMSGDDDQDQP